VIIDADACPRNVLQICLDLGRKYAVQVWTVASFNHQITAEHHHHLVVGNASQETDLRIMNLAETSDVAVTQDWGLAAMLLGKGVRCLSPDGQEFTTDTIEFLLEERAAKEKFRRGGGRTKGPAKRSAANDRHFAQQLEKMLSN
jgi:uncharacterized protein YaiI (UPF0178 family)